MVAGPWSEGLGVQVEYKFGQPFRGFIGANVLITCNSLCCPFTEPSSSKSGWTHEEYLIDNDAMNDRVQLVEFKKKFKDMNVSFDE